MRYRKKPVIVEAEQFLQGQKLPEGVKVTGLYCSTKEEGLQCDLHNLSHLYPHYGIETLEGVMSVRYGDWIITGIQGEHYPCKDEIFRATYELVEEK